MLEKRSRRVMACALAFVLCLTGLLVFSPSYTALAMGTDNDALLAKQAVIAQMTPEQKLMMEAAAEPLIRAAYETALGMPLVTEAYWPPKTWYNLDALAIAYDGDTQLGYDYFAEDLANSFWLMMENMHIKVHYDFIYEADKGMVDLDNRYTYMSEYQKVIDTYARGKNYPIIVWYNNGDFLEGESLRSALDYPVVGDLFGWDVLRYGYMGFYKGQDTRLCWKLIQDPLVPSAAGYYTVPGATADHPSVQRLVGFLEDCQTPYSEWNWYVRQVCSKEIYIWAEYCGANERLQIPDKGDPDEIISLFGRYDAQLGKTGGRGYDRGDRTDLEAMFELSQNLGKWNYDTLDGQGNYENLAYAMFLACNDLPKGTKAIFPYDIFTLEELAAFSLE